MSDTTQSLSFSEQSSRAKGSVLSQLVQAYAGWQQRKRLATLDDATLRDIGLTRHEAEAEAARPLWNAPDRWLR